MHTAKTDEALDLLRQAKRLGIIDDETYQQGVPDVIMNGPTVLRTYLGNSLDTLATPKAAQGSILDHHEQVINESPAALDPIEIDTTSRGFMMRALIATTLPHVELKVPEFVRNNGRTTLVMHLPQELFKNGFRLPYGPMPRLILLWITSEVYRCKEAVLHLGASQSEFMRRVNLTPITGPKGNFESFHKQLKNLFATSYTAIEKDEKGTLKGLNIRQQPLGSASFWWDDKDQILKDATITLNPEFHRAILESAIPVDLNVVNKLKGSSMKLDLFWWLSWRLSYLDRPIIIKWAQLQEQFGTTIKGTRQVRQVILKALKAVGEVFPIAADHAKEVDQGIRLDPVRPSVAQGYRRQGSLGH